MVWTVCVCVCERENEIQVNRPIIKSKGCRALEPTERHRIIHQHSTVPSVILSTSAAPIAKQRAALRPPFYKTIPLHSMTVQCKKLQTNTHTHTSARPASQGHLYKWNIQCTNKCHCAPGGWLLLWLKTNSKLNLRTARQNCAKSVLETDHIKCFGCGINRKKNNP